MGTISVEVSGGVAYSDHAGVIIFDLDNFEDTGLVGHVVIGRNGDIYVDGIEDFIVVGSTDDEVYENVIEYAKDNGKALVRVLGGVAEVEYVPEGERVEIIDHD